MATLPGCASEKPTGETLSNRDALIAALSLEAEQRVAAAGSAVSMEALLSDSSQKAEYPATFDLRAVDTDGDGVTENYVTSVKQQHPFGTCWAFASITAAETSILYDLKQDAVTTKEDGSPADSIDLSEHHLAWFAYTPLPDGEEQAREGLNSMVDGVADNASLRMSSGSTQFAAASLFASGMGPVSEPDFDTAQLPESALNYHGLKRMTTENPTTHVLEYSEEDDWSVEESQRFRQSYMLEDAYFLPSPVSFAEDGTYDMDYAGQVTAAYKEQLMQGRGVSISYCADNYHPVKKEAAPKYINTVDGTWAHYTYEPVRANHAVTIVGWDDNYSAENFLTEVQERDKEGNLLTNADGTPKMKTVSQPPENGAWIVKNSWGCTDPIAPGLNTYSWGIDGSGYFYLSYYDQSLETAQCFDFDVTNALKADLGEYILQEYDYMPCEIPHSVTTGFPVAAANVFTAEENETVKALSCTTTQCNEELTFQIFALKDDSRAPSADNAELLGEYTEIFPSAGLHVVSLPEEYTFDQGQIFIVSVTQKCGEDYLFSVGSEYNQKGFEAGFCDDKYAANAILNAGESYIYLSEDDEWWDFSEVKSLLEGAEGASSYLTYDNFPIKAYAGINTVE